MLLASTRELPKSSASACSLGSRLRRRPPRKKRATSAKKQERGKAKAR